MYIGRQTSCMYSWTLGSKQFINRITRAKKHNSNLNIYISN